MNFNIFYKYGPKYAENAFHNIVISKNKNFAEFKINLIILDDVFTHDFHIQKVGVHNILYAQHSVHESLIRLRFN